MEFEKDIDVIGIGVSTLDILNIVDHFPESEEVQKSQLSRIEGGGPISTAIVTLARLGARTIMMDSLGDDWIGNNIIREFEKVNVNTNYILISKGSTSSLASILTRANDGARTIIYSPGNSPELKINDILPELISRAKYIHINGRHLDVCLEACRLSKIYNTMVSFDGGSYRFKDELRVLIPLTDICIVSKDFADKATGEKEITKSAHKLLNQGPKIVVITDGINGSWLFTDQINGYFQKAFNMPKVVDTTGCGDSYHGAFLFSLCRGSSLIESIKTASAVAALNTQELGGRSALPTLTKLEEFLKYNS